MILTIDIGLKNLAMCILDNPVHLPHNKKPKAQKSYDQYRIHLWEVFNTLSEDEPEKCKSHLKNGKECGKKACLKIITDDVHHFTCKTHFPKDITQTDKHKIKPPKRVQDYLLQDITKIVLKKLEEIYNTHIDLFSKVTRIFIELQPKVNNKMKLVSHLIYGKLVEKYIDTNTTVRFVRASQKLKAYRGPVIECNLKGAYAKRKFLSVQYTLWILNNLFDQDEADKWRQLFNSHSKKDDLGDVFLMAINNC